MSRQPRDRRRAGVRVRLSDRDQAVIQALARFRLARTSDLVDFAFPETRRDTVARRLRRLFDAGFLDVRSGDRSEENLYVLGPGGRAWVESHGGNPLRAPRGGLAHHVAIVRAWVDLALVADRIDGLQLGLVRSDWEIREHPETAGSPVIPDALVQLSIGNGHDQQAIRLALEVDLGTEPLSVLARKVGAYERQRQSGGLFGWPGFGLCAFVPSASLSRRRSVESCIARNWSGWWLVWRDRDELQTLLTNAVNELRPPLTPSPRRKGRDATLTTECTMSSQPTDRRP